MALDPLTLMEPATVGSDETGAAAMGCDPIPFQISRPITTTERAMWLRFCVFIGHLRCMI
jgi:hypothetical protein